MAEAANGTLGGFAQEGFELAKGRLDRVEVRRIARQVTQRRTGGLDGFAHTGDLMGFEVVDDHDVTALEGGSQTLFEIGDKACASHRSIDHEWCDHPVMAQPGHECDGLPMSLRHVADQSQAARTTPAQPRHIGRGGGLVDEHQSGRVK